MLASLRRIAYSFLGLIAGNVVLYFLNFAVVMQEALSAGKPSPVMNARSFVGMIYFLPFSLAGWTLLGLPFAIFVPSRALTRSHILLSPLVGALIGPLSLLLACALVSLREPKLYEPKLYELAMMPLALAYAAVVGGSTFLLYVLLLRRERA